MTADEQQVQPGSAGKERPPLALDRTAKTSRGSRARLENPLGISADRCVEASAKVRDEQLCAAVLRLASAEDVDPELANGAQESGLQHRCACSARSAVSTSFGTSEKRNRD